MDKQIDMRDVPQQSDVAQSWGISVPCVFPEVSRTVARVEGTTYDSEERRQLKFANDLLTILLLLAIYICALGWWAYFKEANHKLMEVQAICREQ